MIDTDLIAHIQGLATGAGARVYYGNAPQDPTLPLVVVSVVSRQDQRALSGELIYTRSVFRLDFFGKIYDDVHAIATAVDASLNNFRGALGTTTTVLIGRRESFGPDLSEVEGDKTLRHLPAEYSFAHKEA